MLRAVVSLVGFVVVARTAGLVVHHLARTRTVQIWPGRIWISVSEPPDGPAYISIWGDVDTGPSRLLFWLARCVFLGQVTDSRELAVDR